MKINYNSEDLSDHQTIGAVIFDEDKRILMQDHKKYTFWTIPIVKVKPNQTVIDALKTELNEECNIEIIDFKELENKKYSYIRNEKKVKVFLHLFKINKFKGKIKNKEPQKHNKQIFLTLDEILKKRYLSDATIFYLNSLGYKRSSML